MPQELSELALERNMAAQRSLSILPVPSGLHLTGLCWFRGDIHPAGSCVPGTCVERHISVGVAGAADADGEEETGSV